MSTPLEIEDGSLCRPSVNGDDGGTAKMKISVALCTYNGARYLQAQLDSIATQARPPEEMLVCDDNSQDDSVEIIHAFARQVSFPVRFHINQKQLGITRNFEQAIALCGGDVIALCDQDDVWHPQKLQRIAEIFAARPKVGVVFTDAEVVNENLQPSGYTLWQRIKFGRARQTRMKGSRGLDVMLKRSPALGMTMAFRATFKKTVLPIPPAVPHDMWVGLIIAALADISLISAPLVKYRQHSSQEVGINKTPEAAHTRPPGTEFSDRATLFAVLEVTRLACERLKELRQADENSIALLQAKVAHLRARMGMPQGRASRFPVAMRELISRRYFRYSNGVYSFAKDLLR